MTATMVYQGKLKHSTLLLGWHTRVHFRLFFRQLHLLVRHPVLQLHEFVSATLLGTGTLDVMIGFRVSPVNDHPDPSAPAAGRFGQASTSQNHTLPAWKARAAWNENASDVMGSCSGFEQLNKRWARRWSSLTKLSNPYNIQTNCSILEIESSVKESCSRIPVRRW